MDYGKDHYATVTFDNAFDSEGRMAMSNLVFPTEPYNSLKVKGGKATVYTIALNN